MARPADMQCMALREGATKRTSSPVRCDYERAPIPGNPGAWSKYCKGHRAEYVRMRRDRVRDENGDSIAPVVIRDNQRQRTPWNNQGAWERGNPL